ncbi:MAG: PQQ-binding-like beta-propeller repeat protein [Blastocatellales bacterium]
MNLLLILLLIFNLITPITTANGKADVWPGFRGAGDSHTAARRLPLEWADDKNIAWDVALPGYGQSSPVVWRDKIFLTAVEGADKEKLLIFGHDLKSGRQLWLKEFQATFTMKDAKTVSKAAPTTAVDDRRVYVFFESGDLFAFDHKGNLQWQRKLAEEYGSYKTNHGLGSSIALTDKAVIALVAHGGPSYLLAVDKQTGKNLWKADLKSGGGWSSPIIINHRNKQQILISISGGVALYDAANGQQIWSVGGLKGNNIPSPSVDLEQNIIVAGSSDKGMNVAIRLGGEGDVTNSHVLWRANEATANFCSPLIHQGRVYFVNKVGVAFCLDLKTGEELWRQRLDGEVWASPLAAGDRIYIFGVDGKTRVLRAGAKFEQLAVNTLSGVERVYGVAAVDSGLLLRSGRKLIKLAGK